MSLTVGLHLIQSPTAELNLSLTVVKDIFGVERIILTRDLNAHFVLYKSANYDVDIKRFQIKTQCSRRYICKYRRAT